MEAIRRGDLGIGFDSGSFFSDLNAEIVAYIPDKTSVWGYSQAESNRFQ